MFARCFSSVGDQQNGQILSLGDGCDHKAVIEHELLHALGFYHEQSRQDRDDYVKIWLDQVTPGQYQSGLWLMRDSKGGVSWPQRAKWRVLLRPSTNTIQPSTIHNM